MARAVLVGDCRPLSAADIMDAGHAAVSVQTAKEAWGYVMSSTSNTETHEADVAVLGVNLSETERGELVYWMEQETSILPVLVLVNTAAAHSSAYGYYAGR
jgi:hypothetical protein